LLTLEAGILSLTAEIKEALTSFVLDTMPIQSPHHVISEAPHILLDTVE
jgi:hypothetical protein